ncbi:MAG: M3 family metallopeptidase, partial [Candidatus Dependentiae bacterium]
MSVRVHRLLLFSLAALTATSHSAAAFDSAHFERLLEGKVYTPADAVSLLPHTIEEVFARKDFAIARAKSQLADFLSIPSAQRTFENTVGFFDEIHKQMSIVGCGIHRRSMVESDDALRGACFQAEQELDAFSVDHFSTKEVYRAFKEYEQGVWQTEILNDKQRAIMRGSMRGFARAGYELDDEAFAKLKKIEKEIAALSTEVQRAIAEDNREILVAKDALPGVALDFVAALEEREGMLVIPCTYPSSAAIMGYCSNSATRRAFSLEMNKRGMPKNETLMPALFAKRNEQAQLLGYESYAAYSIEEQMAETPETVEEFLSDLKPAVTEAYVQEMKHLQQNLPADVALTDDGKFAIGDMSYIYTQYRKKHFGLDSREISQYFPLEKTVKGLFHIYEQLLGITLKEEVVENAWHESVRLLSVRRPHDNALLGYVLLDLFPRKNKYSHACNASLTFAKNNEVATTLVIANFTPGENGKPSLMRHSEVETFFHEFGHAMHTILGRTDFYSTSGTHVERDFVEMPSQIFERWIWDAQLLKDISSHYATGEPLPDHIIENMLASRNLGSAYNYAYQIMAAQISLECHRAHEHVDLSALWNTSIRETFPFGEAKEIDCGFASFSHLENYGA